MNCLLALVIGDVTVTLKGTALLLSTLAVMVVCLYFAFSTSNFSLRIRRRRAQVPSYLIYPVYRIVLKKYVLCVALFVLPFMVILPVYVAPLVFAVFLFSGKMRTLHELWVGLGYSANALSVIHISAFAVGIALNLCLYKLIWGLLI